MVTRYLIATAALLAGTTVSCVPPDTRLVDARVGSAVLASDSAGRAFVAAAGAEGPTETAGHDRVSVSDRNRRDDPLEPRR